MATIDRSVFERKDGDRFASRKRIKQIARESALFC
jgi:hypothetical protein